MPIQIVRNDITRMRVDAIVNAANNALADGGGVTGAIFREAGPLLAAECRLLGGCRTGEAKITRGYRLPCRYVIHTVGPVWRGGGAGEEQLLTSCYRASLALAKARRCKSVAFPLISSGIYGYPKEQALRVAMAAISGFLLENDDDMQIYLVVFTRDSVQIGRKLFSRIEQYIDDHYVDAHADARRRLRDKMRLESLSMTLGDTRDFSPASLEQALAQMDESFSQMVLRKIGEKGMKNADCYKRANIDKKLFSKIHNDVHYKPKKATALALAVALELPIGETRELLQKAGLALSRSEKFDVIVEFFILQGQYDIFEINEALFYYDQPLLGGAVL